MTSRPWYAHFPADYERKTSHLTMLEDGAYRRLLDHYYATGKPLPANAERLYRICRAFADAERTAIDTVTAQFFIKRRDGYHNKRADEEIETANELGEKRRNAALSRYSKSTANALQLHTPSPSPSHTKNISRRKVLNGSAPHFDEFWLAYPKRVAKGAAIKAYAKAIKKADAPTILAGVTRYAGARKGEDVTYTMHPATWLNQERWLDDALGGLTASSLTPEQQVAQQDRADRILKRGKYAPKADP